MPKKKSANQKEIVKLHCWKCGFVFTEKLLDGWEVGRSMGDPHVDPVFNENRREGLLKGRKSGHGYDVTDLVCPNCSDIYKIQRFTKKKAVSESKIALNKILRRWQDQIDGKNGGKSQLQEWHKQFKDRNIKAWKETGSPIIAFDVESIVVFDVLPGPGGDPLPATMPYIDYASPEIYKGMNRGSSYHKRFELEFAPWDVSYCFVDAHRTLEELLAATFPHYSKLLLSYVLRKPTDQITRKIGEVVARRKALLPDISVLIKRFRTLLSDGKAYSQIETVLDEINTLARQWTFRPPRSQL